MLTLNDHLILKYIAEWMQLGELFSSSSCTDLAGLAGKYELAREACAHIFNYLAGYDKEEMDSMRVPVYLKYVYYCIFSSTVKPR